VVKKVKEGYKKTELGWIPEEWEIKQLNDISELIMGQSPDSDTYNDNGKGIPFFQGKTEFGRISPIVRKWCTKPTKIAKPLDILISVRAPVGEVNINIVEACIGRGLAAIREKNNNYKFIYYYMQSIKEKLNFSAQGSTFTAINSGDLKQLKTIVPPLKEQQKIAEILSSVDTQIDDTDKLIEKTKELKKGLMQRFLTKGIGHTEFKMTEVGDIPMEWEVKKISDICNVNGGKRLPKGYQLIDDKNKNPYIRVADMHNGGISLEDIKYVPNEAVNSIKNYTISKDDLFISVAGTLGIVGKVPECLDGANLTENADKLCDIKINKDFLMRVLQSDLIQKIIDSEKTSNAQPKLALTRIKEFLIPIPEKEEQEKIANILISVDTQIEEYENKKKKLEELKKGLMQKLLTGKIRVV